MTTISKMNGPRVLAELDLLKGRWTSSPTSAQIRRRDDLLNRLYTPQKGWKLNFWAQDDNGFPKHRISNTDTETQTFSVLQLRQSMRRQTWPDTIGMPKDFDGTWPPHDWKDIIPLAEEKEACFDCFAVTYSACDADHEDFETLYNYDWTNKWMHEFRLKEVVGMGHGLHANMDFEKNLAIGQYTGELLLSDPSFASNYHAGIEIGPLQLNGTSQATCNIDATTCGSVFRFTNHSCNPNTSLEIARCGRSRRMLVVTTKRLIRAGDEITLDYGPKFWTEESPCRCGSKVPRCKYSASEFRRKRLAAEKKEFKEKKRSCDESESSELSELDGDVEMEDLRKEATPSDVEMKYPSEEEGPPAKKRRGEGTRRDKRGRFV